MIRNKFIRNISTFIRNSITNSKFLLKCSFKTIKKTDTFYFVISPSKKHPGLADRIKAIISCYNEAKLNGLSFKIIYKEPFVLEEYLKPSTENNNWIADYNDLEYSYIKTRFVNEDSTWHLKVKKGKQYHCYNYKGDLLPEVFSNSNERWCDLFSELFTPNDEIQQMIKNTGLKRKTYAAVHLRFVNALENFEKGYGNNLNTDEEKLDLIKRCHDGLKRIIAECKNKNINTVVVFSDSKKFLDTLADFPVVVLNPDSIGHISFDNDKANITKTFLDFFVISNAAIVYRIGAKEMYMSSCFALCAARVGDIKFESYVV